MARGDDPRAVRLLASVLAAESADQAHDLLVPLEDAQVMRLVQMARAHAVEPWIARYAPRQDGPWQELAAQRTRFTGAHARAMACLRGLRQIFRNLECPWAVLKGRALAEQFYPRPDMRFEVDLDVLVPPERFESVLIELQARGWKLIDQNWRLAAEVLPAELRLLSANGDLLDLHWHLLSEAGLRKQFTIPTTSLLARRRELGSGMPVLNAVDQLVHLGIHGALSGANRLSWLLDAGLAARHVQSWNDVAVATRSAGAGPALGLVLARARRELGTPAPPKALRQMGAGLGWRTATAAIDALSPLRISPDDPALARSWARSARRSALSSFAEFTGHAVGWATSGAPQRRAASPLKDPADPRSPLYPAADPVAREAYFSAVASAETSSEIA